MAGALEREGWLSSNHHETASVDHVWITNPRPPLILVADDDVHICQLFETVLEDEGFEVISASDGYEMLLLAQERAPNLILVDLNMPRMDGYEAIRQLRNDTRIAHIPVLIVTAFSTVNDIVVGFETGADDYIAKPFDINELLARVRSHLRRSAQRPVLNPLTGLPGGVLLSQELRRRLATAEPFALLYIDIDNFKAFNDIYGFSRGDQAIRAVAELVQGTMLTQNEPHNFVSHIGGDDFAALTTVEYIHQTCGSLLSRFEQHISSLYNPEDVKRGYISSSDRYGVLRRFGLMTLSIGVVTTKMGQFQDELTLTRVAAEMKRYAKDQGGNTYAIDQRRSRHQQTHRLERRRQNFGVLIASTDTSLRSILRSTLDESGYILSEATSGDVLRQRIQQYHPQVVLVDDQLGSELWALCNDASFADKPAIVVLSYDDVPPEHATYATVCLHLPLSFTTIVQCIDSFLPGPATDDRSSHNTI